MMKILYIEDNMINRMVVEKGMQAFATVITEENGFKGIELALSDHFDVILIDLNLGDPDIDGFGVLEQLKEKGVPAKMIALTALVGEEWKQKCKDAGFDHYLPKPIKPKEIWKEIQSLDTNSI